MSLLKKIKNKLFQKPQNSERSDQVAKTKELRAEASSDVERWSKNQSLKEDWNIRTKMLGDFVPNGSKVIEFGAGAMFLKDYLNDTITYTASDIVQRYPETIVFDLNDLSRKIDLTPYDTAVLSGVLEYIYDIEAVLLFLYPNIKNICVSYCCADIAKDNRLKNGWLSDYTEVALKEIFESCHYEVMEQTLWRSQSLFYLRKKRN
ncbi:hypothetical protein ACFO3O_20450 [Dokdonia ponticola]|uniref:Class I SAM-dependent methyltransferase n=1 Tax=Dokdonia ponticola TaxID=2041041 RepID=A0ABV9I4B7_9FLAO